MQCPKCHAHVPEGAHECLECGMPLRESAMLASPLRTAYIVAAIGALMLCAGAMMMLTASAKARQTPPTVVAATNTSRPIIGPGSAPPSNTTVGLTYPGSSQPILGPARPSTQTNTTDDAAPQDNSGLTAQNQATNPFDQYMDRIQNPGQSVDDAMDSLDRITLAKERTNAPLSAEEDQEISNDIARLQTARTAFRSFQPDADFERLRDLTVQTIDATMDVADRFRMYLNAGQTSEDEVMKSDAQRLVNLKQQVAAEMDRLRARYP